MLETELVEVAFSDADDGGSSCSGLAGWWGLMMFVLMFHFFDFCEGSGDGLVRAVFVLMRCPLELDAKPSFQALTFMEALRLICSY